MSKLSLLLSDGWHQFRCDDPNHVVSRHFLRSLLNRSASAAERMIKARYPEVKVERTRGTVQLDFYLTSGSVVLYHSIEGDIVHTVQHNHILLGWMATQAQQIHK